MIQITKRFLLIDDDRINNYITKMILQKTFEGVEVIDFIDAEVGLEFIKSEPKNIVINEKTTLFLDINMPTLSGWEFLEAFALFDEEIKNQYNIYILSSSINISDINLANENHFVLDFIEKPVNKVKLVKLFS